MTKRKKKVEKPRKSAEKPRNGGLWTEARFNSFVTSALRAAFRRWQPKYTTLKRSFVESRINPKSGRIAKHYRCNACGNSFPQLQVQIDHVEPIGRGLSWNKFIERLFCEAENLQVLCKVCHKEKTKNESR